MLLLLLLFLLLLLLSLLQVDGKMALYDKLFESHPVAIGKAISKMERWAVVGKGLELAGTGLALLVFAF